VRHVYSSIKSTKSLSFCLIFSSSLTNLTFS